MAKKEKRTDKKHYVKDPKIRNFGFEIPKKPVKPVKPAQKPKKD